MNISEMVAAAYATATDKGWHNEPQSFGEIIALIHSELSEALEAYRQHDTTRVWYEHDGDGHTMKPEGVPIELADAIIRIADMCGHYGIDLESAIKIKMAYNETRSWRHGGKKI